MSINTSSAVLASASEETPQTRLNERQKWMREHRKLMETETPRTTLRKLRGNQGRNEAVQVGRRKMA